MTVWNNVLSTSRNQQAIVHFVEGNCGFRDLKKSVDSTARKELNKISGSNRVKTLARKALRRREIGYTLSV